MAKCKGKDCECDASECYEHCEESENGEHEVDPFSAAACNAPMVVDFNCKHCGQGGSLKIDPAEIHWE